MEAVSFFIKVQVNQEHAQVNQEHVNQEHVKQEHAEDLFETTKYLRLRIFFEIVSNSLKVALSETIHNQGH